MRWMTALMILCTSLVFAQVGTVADSETRLRLPGLKAELMAGMSTDQLKKALLPEISMAGRTDNGVGIFTGEVPLDDGAYALTLGLQNERLVMVGLSSQGPAAHAIDARLREWFDKHVAALHSPQHRSDTDHKGNRRDIWTAGGVRWTRGVVATRKDPIPMYMVEFTRPAEE